MLDSVPSPLFLLNFLANAQLIFGSLQLLIFRQIRGKAPEFFIPFACINPKTIWKSGG